MHSVIWLKFVFTMQLICWVGSFQVKQQLATIGKVNCRWLNVNYNSGWKRQRTIQARWPEGTWLLPRLVTKVDFSFLAATCGSYKNHARKWMTLIIQLESKNCLPPFFDDFWKNRTIFRHAFFWLFFRKSCSYGNMSCQNWSLEAFQRCVINHEVKYRVFKVKTS